MEILYALNTDTSDQKNNVAFSLRGISNKKEFVKLSMSNVASRKTPSNFTITAPKKSVDMENVMGEMYESGY